MRNLKLTYIILFTLLALTFLGSCAKEEEEDDTANTVVVSIDMPDLVAQCKYTTASTGYCDGTPDGVDGSGGMNTNKGIVYITNAASEIVALQLGDLVCGDGGGAKGIHCAMTTQTADWMDVNLTSVTQLPIGVYTYSFQLDKDDNVATIVDISNFGSGDTMCFATITLTAETTEIGDEDATLFTCTTLG